MMVHSRVELTEYEQSHNETCGPDAFVEIIRL